MPAECQKTDWNEHKQICRSLKGGTWHTIAFSRENNPFGEKGMYSFIVNRFDSLQEKGSTVEKPDPDVPPNIHKGRAFLVKFQILLSSEISSMLLYDRQRSFQVHWMKSEDPGAFVHGLEAMADKVKIYRWARRVGDRELSVCFDRAPATDPVW